MPVRRKPQKADRTTGSPHPTIFALHMITTSGDATTPAETMHSRLFQ